MKKINNFILVAMFAIVFCFVSGNIVNAKTGIKFNEKNFPNEFLRQEIFDSVDVNEDGYLSEKEIDSTYEMNIDMNKLGEKHEDGCYDCGTSHSKEDWKRYCIFDCKGLEYFKNLKELRITVYTDYYNLGINCRIKNLSTVNKLTKLEKLTLTGDKVTKKLNFTKLKKLKKLNIGFGKLKQINVSGLSKLNDLCISNGNIKKINLATNKNLKDLIISSPKLKKLDLSNNKKLDYLSAITPNLKTINLDGCKKLRQFSIEGVYKKLDLSSNTKLKKIWIESSKLEKVVFPKNNKIKWIYMDKTPIKNINISKLNPETLTVLNIPYTNVEELDISKLTSLKIIRVPDSTKINKGEGQKAKVIRCDETYDEYIAKYGSI